MSTRPAILTFGFAAFWTFLSPVSLPAEIVLLDTGESLSVQSIRYRDGLVELGLAGGATLLVPAERVDTILETPRQDPPTDPAPPGPDPPAGPDRAWLVEAVARVSREVGVDARLVRAVVQIESGFDPRAISERGACGLMQLLPETAERYDVTDLFDPVENLRAGVSHLRRLLDRYPGRVDLALAAYNAGEGRVDRRRSIPPIRETRNYVERVLALYSKGR